MFVSWREIAHVKNVVERVYVHPQSGLEIHYFHCAREAESDIA